MDSLHTCVCVKQDTRAVTVTQGTIAIPICVIPLTQGSVEMEFLHTHVCVIQDT